MQNIRPMTRGWIIGDKFDEWIQDDADPFHGVDFDGLNLARLSGISTQLEVGNFETHMSYGLKRSS